jgi:uncharacterized protein (TIGR03663 family)
MPIRRLPLLIFILSVVLFRFYDLGIRPPHHDESVNGWFVDGMFVKGFYHYDPHNYHGPLYFYLLGLFRAVFGRSIEVLRAVTVIAGGLLTFSPFLFRRWIGERAAWISVFVFAVSPAIVFFSRYAIHEIPFALSTVLFFYFWLRAREEKFSWKILTGLGLTLGSLACLKENFIIFIACLLIAEVMNRIYGKEKKLPSQYHYYSGSLLIAFFMIVLVYSALGRDEDGISNFFAAFQFWSETGSKGNGHEKPFFYWIKIMLAHEWPTLIGLFLAPMALLKVPQGFRLLSIVSVGVFLAYSIVSYKTPWCLVCFQWGFILIFGYWVSKLWEKMLPLATVLLLLVGFQGVISAYEVSYVNVDAENEYYIYGQTYRSFMQPVGKIIDRVKDNATLKDQLRIQVISGFTWPLPYLLGEIRQVGYYGENNAPEVLDADYLMIDESLEKKYVQRIQGKYNREVVRARQWASSMVIYTREPATN